MSDTECSSWLWLKGWKSKTPFVFSGCGVMHRAVNSERPERRNEILPGCSVSLAWTLEVWWSSWKLFSHCLLNQDTGEGFSLQISTWSSPNPPTSLTIWIKSSTPVFTLTNSSSSLISVNWLLLCCSSIFQTQPSCEYILFSQTKTLLQFSSMKTQAASSFESFSIFVRTHENKTIWTKVSSQISQNKLQHFFFSLSVSCPAFVNQFKWTFCPGNKKQSQSTHLLEPDVGEITWNTDWTPGVSH